MARNVSVVMRHVRSRNTEPEVQLRRVLKRAGVRHKANVTGLPGKPDIVVPGHHLAIFADGDFWHGIQWRKRGLLSLEEQFEKANDSEYWLGKIRRNVSRDCRNTAELLALGWRVIRLWESTIREEPEKCMKLVNEAMKKNGEFNIPCRLTKRTVSEFFAGIGLMRMGLSKSGWEVIFANDIDPKKKLMYNHAYPDCDGHYLVEDVHKLSCDAVPDTTLATASFPCTDLSSAGPRTGINGRQSSAFWGFVEVLRQKGKMRPPLVLLENVAGFLTTHAGANFRSALLALNELGYLVDAFLLDASFFVPQSRKRLFVVGIQRGVLEESGEAGVSATQQPSIVRPHSLVRFMKDNQDIEWHIRPLPEPVRTTDSISDILEPVPVNSPLWWNQERTDYLLGQMSSSHARILNRLKESHRTTYLTAFRRVRNKRSMAEIRADGVAGCLRTPKGGSAKQIVIRVGYNRVRVRHLTPREYSILMGAGDFPIEVDTNDAMFGFADAVCVPVVKWIADQYLNPLINELTHDVILSPAE